MKTKLITFVTLLAFATIITVPASAAVKKDQGATVINEAANFNSIEVRGNVEVYLINGESNTVTAFNNYYGESALVQNQNGKLRISSFSKEPLVVYVTAADLDNVSVYDNAVVKTGNQAFSSIELQINLFDNASAQLNLEAYDAVINVNDRAKANLAGSVANCDMQINQSSTVNTTAFVAGRLIKKINGAAVAKHNQDLAVI